MNFPNLFCYSMSATHPWKIPFTRFIDSPNLNLASSNPAPNRFLLVTDILKSNNPLLRASITLFLLRKNALGPLGVWETKVSTCVILNPLFFALKQKSTSSKYIKNFSNSPLTFSNTSLSKTKQDPALTWSIVKTFTKDYSFYATKFYFTDKNKVEDMMKLKTTFYNPNKPNKCSSFKCVYFKK